VSVEKASMPGSTGRPSSIADAVRDWASTDQAISFVDRSSIAVNVRNRQRII
jgi:hypothetical protein